MRDSKTILQESMHINIGRVPTDSTEYSQQVSETVH